MGFRTLDTIGVSLMSQTTEFNEVLDAAERLAPTWQAELVSVLVRRLAERGRTSLIASVAESRRDFAAGNCLPMSATEIVSQAMAESGALSEEEREPVVVVTPAEADDDRRWEDLLAGSPEKLSRLVERAAQQVQEDRYRTLPIQGTCGD
jgi:hypothetical protein